MRRRRGLLSPTIVLFTYIVTTLVIYAGPMVGGRESALRTTGPKAKMGPAPDEAELSRTSSLYCV